MVCDVQLRLPHLHVVFILLHQHTWRRHHAFQSGQVVTSRAQDWSCLRLFHGGRTEAARQHGRYVGSALFVQAEVKSDDWNASWRHQANGALSDNPIAIVNPFHTCGTSWLSGSVPDVQASDRGFDPRPR